MIGCIMREFDYRRIIIIGNGGAGKSTLARELGEKLGLPVVHLDKLWWLPDWVTRTPEEFDALLEKELAEPKWIMDGNYHRTLSMRLRYADLCIFLDYAVDVCMRGAYARAELYRGKTRPDMTEGCVERVDSEFEEWIRSFDKKVKPSILKIIEESGVPCIAPKTREETAAWVARLGRD